VLGFADGDIDVFGTARQARFAGERHLAANSRVELDRRDDHVLSHHPQPQRPMLRDGLDQALKLPGGGLLAHLALKHIGVDFSLGPPDDRSLQQLSKGIAE